MASKIKKENIKSNTNGKQNKERTIEFGTTAITPNQLYLRL